MGQIARSGSVVDQSFEVVDRCELDAVSVAVYAVRFNVGVWGGLSADVGSFELCG
jgi:hypothetical protein